MFLTDRIAVIDAANGHVVAWLDLSALMPRRPRASDAVLNGIAYDAERDGMWVTGKKWPSMYLIKLTKPAEESSE